jgi:class 3 adenylate cyclase
MIAFGSPKVSAAPSSESQAPENSVEKEFRFVDLGSRTLKGIAEPITVHEVPWRDGDDGRPL